MGKNINVAGYINKIIPFSSVDGEGNRMAVFLQQCNYNCLYCHNPETINRCINCGACIEVCPKGALDLVDGIVKYDIDKCINCDSCISICKNNSSPKILELTVDEVMERVNKVKPFIEGITVSGGECTLQSEFLIQLFTRVKEEGLTTFIDTNGSTPIWQNKALMEVTDKTMIDIKAFDSDENKKLTGMDNQMVIKNVQELAKADKVFEIRTVVVPEVLNNEYTVDMASRMIAELNSDIQYKLIKYRPLGVRKDLIEARVPDDGYMNHLGDIARNNGCNKILIV